MVAQNVAEIINNHLSLEIECIDRMYLNGYVPGLQTEGGFIHFVRKHLGFPIASTAVVAPMSKSFVEAIEAFAKQNKVDLVGFDKQQRKDDVTREYLARATFSEGVLYIGQGAGKSQCVPNDSSAKRQRKIVSLDQPWHGVTESLLFLYSRRRLRTAVHQILWVLSLCDQGLSQRT